MFTFLLIVHALIAAGLVTVILMQRSEGGGLGMGGGPSGLMTARGAADFLTRSTTVLATLFVLMSIGLAALATVSRAPTTVDTSLARTTDAVPLAGDTPAAADPLAAAAAGAGTVAPANALDAATDTSKPAAVPVPGPAAAKQAEQAKKTAERRAAAPAPKLETVPLRQVPTIGGVTGNSTANSSAAPVTITPPPPPAEGNGAQ